MLQKHQKAIQDREVTGTVQDRFNFSLSNTSFKNRQKHIYEKIVAIENCHYLINYSFGYVLRNHMTNELRYFHASGGTDRVFYAQPIQAKLIPDCKDSFCIALPGHLDFISFLGCALFLAGDWPQTTIPNERAYNY